ncbi:MAG: cytochrome c biogenesis protein ResB [Coriobacteriia bacterium]
MRRILDILTSRRTSIALMAFVAFFGALGAWIPQSSLGYADALVIWQSKNPLAARIADAFGLYAIFSSWWFLTALAIFAVVLGVATVRMLRDAWHASRSSGRGPRTLLAGAETSRILERARSAGYRDRSASGDRHVLTRHGIGMWASAVLHVGLLLSLVWAALMLAYTRGAIADFSQGEIREPGAPYYSVEDPEMLPEVGVPWRFDGMETTIWPTGSLKEASASLSFLKDDGTWRQRTSSVNYPLRINGNTIYVQPFQFGDAALLRIVDGAGTEHLMRMEFYFVEPGEVTYAEEPLTIADTAIEGRWDPSGVRDAKPLGLRPAGDDTATPITLVPGETATVADMTVEFVDTAQWARFIVQRSPSAIPLFLGFAIIGLGSLMLYIWIPRELVLKATDEGVMYSWYAARMSRAYLSERDAILGLDSDADKDV